MISKLLSRVDIYGAKVELNFNKKRVHNTTFGGILTIAVVFIFFLGCWFQSKNLITRESPTIINSMRSVQSPERVYLNNKNLTFMVQITDQNGDIVNDPRIIDVYAVQEIYSSEFDTTTNSTIYHTNKNQIKMESCSLDSVGNEELLPYFKKIMYKQMYCFSNNYPNIFIEGDIDSDNFSQIFIQIQKCQNSTNSDGNQFQCLAQDVINNRLKSSKLSIFMSDQFFDPYSFDNPLKFKGVNLYTLTSSFIPKEFQLYFMNQYIQDDVGLLVNDISQKHGFFYSDYKDSVFYADNNLLARILLRMAKHKESFITRRYLKFTDVIGQLGGLLKILMTAGSILSVPFVRLHLHQAIVNEIFNFKFIQEKKLKKSHEQLPNKSFLSKLNTTTKTKKIRSLLSQQNIDDINKDQVNQKTQKPLRIKSKLSDDGKSEIYMCKSKQLGGDTLNQEMYNSCLDPNYTVKKKKTIIEAAKTIFVVTKSIIKYGIIDYIIHFIFPRSKQILRKKILVDQSLNRIFDHLDVLYIMNKMLEIDKLKKILLNEDQLRLFEFIPKPQIEEQKLKEILGVEDSRQPKNLETNTLINRGKIEIIENGKIQDSEILMKKNIDNKILYDLYSRQKTPAEKALDAYQGLVNILKKEKKSERDNKLIDLIDPSILEQYQQQINEFDKKNNLLQLQQSILINNASNQKLNNLDQSDEDINITFQNQTCRTINPPLRSSCFQLFTQRNALNTFKTPSKINSLKDNNESEILSTYLSIPQEINENNKVKRRFSSQSTQFFKSLKDLNGMQQTSHEQQVQRRRVQSFSENRSNTSLINQNTKQKQLKKLYNN